MIHIKRRTLKKLLSLAGTAIVMVTFFVKDAEKDTLKELSNSLEHAESTFEIENAESETAIAVGRFQNEFYQYAATPNRPLWKPEQIFHLGCPAVITTYLSIGEARQSLEIVARLAKKLPDKLGSQFDIERMMKEYQSALQRAIVPHSLCRTVQLIPDIQNLRLPTEPEVADLVKTTQPILIKGNNLSESILKAAADQLEQDEASAKIWTRRYYALFALGSIITVIGILLGDEEEKSAVEEMTEA